MKRILFLPSDHGGGRGHVARMLMLGKRVQALGYEASIVLEKDHFNEGPAAGLSTWLLDLKWERLQKYQFKKPLKPGIKLLTKVKKRPVFVEFGSLAWQVPRDGYWTTRLTNLRFKRLQRIAEKVNPDIIVGDTHFLSRLLGLHLQVPVVQVTRLQGFPPQPDFSWWRQQKPQWDAPDGLAPFTDLLDRMQVTEVRRAEDLLHGDRYAIPSVKEIEPVMRGRSSVHFCGPFTEQSAGRQQISFFAQDSDAANIYVTIGGGAERGQLELFFKRILEIFDKSDFRVLVSTAGKMASRKFNGLSANVVFQDWVDGVSAIRQSDLVVQHGGYGTTMETLRAGRPALVIPAHSEQEANGRRLEALGVGKVILPYADDLKPLEFRWPYGTYAMGAAFELQLEKQVVLQAVNDLLYSPAYAQLQNLQQKLDTVYSRFKPEKLLDF